MNGYRPLVQDWAAQGFVVIQPTHLSSKTLSHDPRVLADPGAPLYWRSRVLALTRIIDHLAAIETLCRKLLAASTTAGMLLGAQLTDTDGTKVSLREPRTKAGVLLTPPGNGGADLSAGTNERLTFFRHPDFSTMTTPALVVSGDKDVSPHLTVRGADWHADPYFLGPKSLLTIFEGEHLLGGISGYDAAETTDENPTRVALVGQLTAAYLRTALDPQDVRWPEASQVLAATTEPVARIESKQASRCGPKICCWPPGGWATRQAASNIAANYPLSPAGKSDGALAFIPANV